MLDGPVVPESVFTITVEEDKVRLDTFLAHYFTHYSRTYFQKLITCKFIQVNGIVIFKSNFVVKKGDSIHITFPPETDVEAKAITTNMPVRIVYQHADFLIINKPPFLSVHSPHVNNHEVTLVDWLLANFKEIKHVGVYDRPGIVHRLDKNTSGLMIISRNNYAHETLSHLFKQRLVKKIYHAIVKGHPEKEGVIDFPIARDLHVRTKMSHKYSSGRTAITYYTVLDYFKDSALVEFRPVTGRTHQIRVHAAAIGHPLLGDELYGTSSKLIKRHALHAIGLEFVYKDEKFNFKLEYPEDFKQVLTLLEKEKNKN